MTQVVTSPIVITSQRVSLVQISSSYHIQKSRYQGGHTLLCSPCTLTIVEKRCTPKGLRIYIDFEQSFGFQDGNERKFYFISFKTTCITQEQRKSAKFFYKYSCMYTCFPVNFRMVRAHPYCTSVLIFFLVRKA